MFPTLRAVKAVPLDDLGIREKIYVRSLTQKELEANKDNESLLMLLVCSADGSLIINHVDEIENIPVAVINRILDVATELHSPTVKKN